MSDLNIYIPTVPNQYANDVCKMGQGADCCKYLMAGPNGLECAKDPANFGFKDQIEANNTMTAKGDNCDGYAP